MIREKISPIIATFQCVSPCVWQKENNYIVAVANSKSLAKENTYCDFKIISARWKKCKNCNWMLGEKRS